VGKDSSDPDSYFMGKISRLNVWNSYGANPQHNVMYTDALIPWPLFWDFYGPIVNGIIIKEPYTELDKGTSNSYFN